MKGGDGGGHPGSSALGGGGGPGHDAEGIGRPKEETKGSDMGMEV